MIELAETPTLPIHGVMPRFSSVLSLFDGMSCGQIALNRVGIEYDNYFASEIDKHAIKVTQANYPKTIQLGDVTKVFAKDLPKIDLLIGGSPCQSFSNAGGEGNGFDGKSGLFWEYVRILNETKPKYFLLENVIMKKKEWEDIISEALGVKPIFIDSKLVSAQRRPRLYWTNIPITEMPTDNGILFKDIIDLNADKYELSDVLKSRYKQKIIDNGSKLVIGTTVIDGKIGQRDRVYGVNNKIPTLTATDYKQPKQVLVNGILRKVTPLEFERLQTVPDNYTNCVSDTQRYKMLGNGWTIDIIAHIFGSLLNGA
jgi:site-specific DNA-cytosine methylase